MSALSRPYGLHRGLRHSGECMPLNLRPLKQILPPGLRKYAESVYRVFHHEERDLSGFWREKASRDGWQTIYWHNTTYNECFDRDQKMFLKEFVEKNGLSAHDTILDLGCGIGRISRYLSDIGFLKITAVDFPEMIEKAKTINHSSSITYLSSSAQDFLVREKFKLILSLSCFGSMGRRDLMFKALTNCIAMNDHGGMVLMIDPFHRLGYLARGRVRVSGKEIIRFMKARGYALKDRSGICFFPARIFAANKWDMDAGSTETLFKSGEKIMSITSRYLFSDYKILSFKKISEK